MGRSCWQRGWNPHACQLFCASRRPWKTAGKSHVALRLFLLVCFVSQVGACWAWEYKQEKNTNQEKKVAKGCWLVLCILSAFVCRDITKENQVSIPEVKKSS